MHWKCAWRILGILKKVRSWFLQSEEEGWLLLACSGLVAGATCVGGTNGKASKERLCLSPYVEKPFNSKVIKRFVPELRSRKCFSCFGIPIFYVYMLWTFYVRFTYPYHRYATWSELIIINKKKRTCWIVDFAVLADHRVKLKESEKKGKYLNLARNGKTMEYESDVYTNCNWCLGTVTKGLIQGLEDLEITGRVGTIQTTALLRSSRILRRVLETWGDLLKLQWETIS